MPVPNFESLMLPVLKALAEGEEVPVSEVRSRVADAEGLTSDEVRELLPSGRQRIFVNRVGWAMTEVFHAGLVERVQHGVYRLTEEGKSLLAQTPSRIDRKMLRSYPPYVEWIDKSNVSPTEKGAMTTQGDDSIDTPEEVLDRAARQLRDVLEADVLDRVRKAPPEFLEQVVIDLLVAMGYGGGDSARGRVTGGTSDGGIDGTIQEDALGLDEVYVQAKKYADHNTVGEGSLRNFAGAIDAAGTTKGVFVTTASFTKTAIDYVARSPKRIVLIDGEELARLMVTHNIGVRAKERYEIKRIDEDYFEQEVL